MTKKQLRKFKITKEMIDEMNKIREVCGFEKEDYKEVGQEQTYLFG